MSRWTQKLRRGGAQSYGTLPPPATTDWIASTGGSGEIIVHRYNPIPAPATLCGARYRPTSGTTWLYWANQTSDTFTIGGLTPGASYELQIAWWTTPARASEFSDTKIQAAGT
jgi:hypothetical protein